MKKSLVSLLLVAALALGLCPGVLAAREVTEATLNYRGISIRINGKYIAPTDAQGNIVEPFIVDGTTYLPVRAVAGALGLSVGWDAATSTVTLTSGAEVSGTPLETPPTHTGLASKTETVVYRDIQLVLDGETVTPRDASGKTVEPFIIDGTTYLPVRAVADALGLEVDWDNDTCTVTLTSPAPVELDYLLTQELCEVRIGDSLASMDRKTLQTYVYDADGRLAETTRYLPEGHITERYIYGEDGQLLQASSSDKNTVTVYTYTAKGEPLTEKTSSDEGASEIQYTYNAEGEVTEYVQVDTDAAGRKLDSSLTVTRRFDADGHLTRETCTWPNRTCTDKYEYDTRGNMTKSIHSEADFTEIWHYTYDLEGKLLTRRASDGSETVNYSYDKDGNLVSEICLRDGATDTTVYTYKDGVLVKQVYASSGGTSESREWAYDADGQLIQEAYSSSKGESWSAVYVRSADGSQSRCVKTYADGSTETLTLLYDEAGNLLSRETVGKNFWERYSYEYAAVAKP